MKHISLALAFLLVGCMSATLDKTQRTAAARRDGVVRDSLAGVYQEISRSGASGALLVIGPQGERLGTTVAIAGTPFELNRLSELPKNSHCFYVYRYEMAMEPSHYACEQFAEDLDRLRKIDSEIDTANTEIAALKKMVSEYEGGLSTSLRMGLINSDLIKTHAELLKQLGQFVEQNKDQLAILDGTFAKLIADFNANTKKIEEAVAKLPK